MYEAAIDDQTPNAAKIVIHRFHDRIEPIEIDFLRAIYGFAYEDEQRVKRRAIPVDVEGMQLLVMDPIDCLYSRVLNDNLPGEADRPESVAQIRLSLTVARAYAEATVHAEPGQRPLVFRLAEEIAEIASSPAGIRVFLRHGIGVLDAVPVDHITSTSFRERRWPQVVAHVSSRRNKARDALDRSR